MTKSCAVRKCKTGYRSIKQKCSVFKAPKNIEQFKKWQAAIPHIELKQSQYICEKHFEKHYILKEWIKRDCNGQIIVQIPYMRPRLAESAVPTIFDSPIKVEQGVSQFQNSQCPSAWQNEFVEQKGGPSREYIKHEVLSLMKAGSITSIKQNCRVVETVSAVCNKNFNISNITNNCDSKVDTSSKVSENNSIIIPKSWVLRSSLKKEEKV